MANGRGYLGKISAIISANTGDYVRKLDESANRTRAFARTIQNDLNRAARASSRSIEGILTPLQRFERAIQNAASARLRFRGVDVAVRTIDELRRSIASLEGDREREFAVRVSGLRNITELKNVLTDIREEDIDLALNVGGVEGLRRLRQEVEEVNGQQVNIRTERTAEQLDVLIDKFSRLSPERIRQLQIRVESRQIDAAIQKERQLLSLAREIASPLATAAGEFDKLSASVQAEFIPALSRSQNVVQSVADRIEAGGTIGRRAFRRIADEVRLTTQAVERLSEAQRLVQSIGTGRALRDTSPRQFDALTRAAQQTQRSEALSAQVAAQFGLGDRQRRVADAARGVEAASARRESQELDLARARRAGNTEEEVRLQRQVERTVQLEQRRTAELDRQLNAQQRQLEQAERFEAAVQTGASTPFASFRDPQGRTIAERIRQQAAVREEQERLAEQAADQQRRREVASTLLPPVVTPPGDDIRGRLGPDIESASAEFSRLEAATVSVRGQIENLPAPIRGQFIPAIRDAVEELVRLQTTNAGADEIARATQRVNELRASVTRADRAFQAFGGNFRDFADGADFQGAAGRLQFLRQQLLRATGDTTRAEEAVDELADAFRQAASTPGGFRRLADQLNQVEREAVEAAAAVLRINPQRLAEQLRRAGDVSRGGFSNVQLAVQQAAFAVDDFFSVTGDLSQRIRAAGNNISQLAFILGGTRGLIIGVAASIGAQLVVAITRWINSGVEAQDSTKALNDALKEQLRLVDELAKSFSQLGRSITLDAFSGGARSAEEFRREIEQLRQQQEDARRQRAGLFDPEAQRQRAIQARSERELQNATEIGDIVALQGEVQQARARERAAADEVFRRPPVTPDQAANAIVESIEAQFDARAQDAQDQAARNDLDAGAARQRVLDERRRRLDREQRPQDLVQAESAVQARIDELTQQRRSQRGSFGFFRTREANVALQELERLQQVLVGIQNARAQELDDATIQFIEGIRAAASGIQSAQQDLQDSIRQGVPGALLLGQELQASADSLTAAQTDFQQASSEVRNALDLPSATEQERADRDAALTAARQREQEAAQRVEEERVRARPLLDRAFAARQQLALDPQAAIDAVLARASANLSAAGAESGALARRAREIEFQRAEVERARQSAEFVNDPLSQRLFQQSIDALSAQSQELEVASLRVREFGQSLAQAQQRIASSVDQAVNSLEQARDLDAGFSTQFSRDQVRRAREDLDERRRNQSAANAAIDARRAELEQGSPFDAEFRRLREINERLLSGEASVDEQRRLVEERRRIEQAVAPERQRIDDEVNRDPAVEAARRAARRQELEARGFDLARTPAQRASEELARDLEALRLAFARQAEETTGLIDQAGLREAQDRRVAESVRQQAPLLAQFSDEVFNALLQGPSRAALQATDASTLEGQRELNRLLRGDDPARDVNLLELQRQTAELEKLVELAQNGPQVAN